MKIHMGPAIVAGLLLSASGLLAGCDTIRAATGADKQPPDEFAVLTKAPLIIPPDYNLHPPKPGAAPANQTEPTQSAEQALFGADAVNAASAMPGNESPGEKLLLANAGAQNADPAIRQDLATDRNHALQSSSDDFTDAILFWQKPDKDEGLNADAEVKSASSQDAAKPAASSPPVSPAAPADSNPPATIDKDKKSRSGGWFDWF
ncbi:MAG: DUF3035 domain-containing protein [Alphaproteobacteria bacterium]|nr:DUF3035 domain-containing protein [Alphaproteobacteria bacterium]